ncbi:MAG: tetratricopeptide repeat protein [Plectolyngbya sp. WJT66-NPBG17]|jgi:tetratricopeptide (TPR) repeat protein|nr:tetratricopeptide repeat protein [Plectolyngbya sp. WJT66-NPBG17]
MLMSVVDRYSAQDIPVTEIISQGSSSLNQQIYLRLRLALSLNLRRQILIAVCDDVTLRSQFATQLETDVATEPVSNISSRLISFALDLNNPDVLEQIRQSFDPGIGLSNFQITGIDQLTRQPVHIQRTFLDSLSTIAQQLPNLEFNLVIWVTRPWCRAIQQSVPEFWNWHTGLFEFEGDPFEQNQIQPVSKNGSSNGHRKLKLDSDLADFVLASVMQMIDLDDQTALTKVLETNHPDTEPLQILHQIEELHQARSSAPSLAALYRQLGDWYRDRLDPVRPAAQHLTIVIRAYEQALKLVDMKSEEVSDLLNDIANLYWIKARSGSGSVATNLEKALKAYQFALDRTSPELQPQTYAMIQNNLGSVYSDLAVQRSPEENLQSAIEAYQASIQHRSFETDPARYAATQNNLGTAYWNLAQYRSSMINLQSAINAYNEALRYYTPEQEPLHYAMLQNNLGTAYWNLSRCDQAVQELAMAEDFLHLAIGAYRVALIYRTLEAAPLSYAATQNNLGTAYWHLANQESTHHDDRSIHLLCAIDAYQEALSAVQYLAAASTPHAPSLSFDVSATHHHIGLTYYRTAIDSHTELSLPERTKFLHHALRHQVRSAQGWQDQPDFQLSAVAQFSQIVKTIYDREGIQGQTQALSQIPPAFLPQVMREL